jgi:D-alanine-D-alanine ligase
MEQAMNIAVFFGGKSGEHEVSLLSATSIVRNIPVAGNSVILVGIDKDGAWYLQEESMSRAVRDDPSSTLSIAADESRRVSVIPGGGRSGALFARGKAIPVDVAFPVLHGSFGEDGTIQGLFEMADIPYVGGGVMASSVAMDKEKTKIVWQSAGLPVVPYIAVKRHEWLDAASKKTVMANAERTLGQTLFVKPACAGSSVGADKATNRAELEKRVDEAFAWDDKILIEPFVPAREIECSVTGNEKPVAYAPGEIVPTHEFYDYDAKYVDPDGAALRVPADLDEAMARKVRTLAVDAYRALDLTGFSRVDFFIDKRTGELRLNEINTIPGFTSISMFPKMCEASGLPYEALVAHLIELAVGRFESRRRLRTSRG